MAITDKKLKIYTIGNKNIFVLRIIGCVYEVYWQLNTASFFHKKLTIIHNFICLTSNSQCWANVSEAPATIDSNSCMFPTVY